MIENHPDDTEKDLNLPETIKEEQVGGGIQTQKQLIDNTLISNRQTDNQPDIPNSQQTEMEIYHQPDMHHRKKPWKEYLFEFLMIFLAVTLGFFAETLREYISEKR